MPDARAYKGPLPNYSQLQVRPSRTGHLYRQRSRHGIGIYQSFDRRGRGGGVVNGRVGEVQSRSTSRLGAEFRADYDALTAQYFDADQNVVRQDYVMTRGTKN